MPVYCNQPYINMQAVCFGYNRRRPPVVQDLDLQCSLDEWVAVMGPNGSGKSTMVKLVMGVLRPWSGQIEIGGEPSSSLSLGQIGKRIGYVFQEPERQLFTGSVWEELEFVWTLQGEVGEAQHEKVRRSLEDFDLVHVRDSFPHTLSRGEKQRLALAAVMINEPPFLVLDEPTTGLDRIRRQQLSHKLHRLRGQGIGAMIVTHDRKFAEEHTTRMIAMDRGKVVRGE